MGTKQVIVWRNDLQVRTGKKMAMAAHASMAFLTREGGVHRWYKTCDGWVDGESFRFENAGDEIKKHWHAIDDWLTNSFKKVVVYVNSEEELKELHQKALDSGLMSHLIEDNGATEFHGVKTLTCLAIGPDNDENFEGLTDHLPLL